MSIDNILSIVNLIKKSKIETLDMGNVVIDEESIFNITKALLYTKTLKNIILFGSFSIESFYYISNIIKSGFRFEYFSCSFFDHNIIFKICNDTWKIIILTSNNINNEFLKEFTKNQKVNNIIFKYDSTNHDLIAKQIDEFFENIALYSINKNIYSRLVKKIPENNNESKKRKFEEVTG